MTRWLIAILFIINCFTPLNAAGPAAEYIGGTLQAIPVNTDGTIVTTDPLNFIFSTRKSMVEVPYERINQIEYGQKVDRRIVEAFLISPFFLLAKKRAHFLTVAYETNEGQQQAIVLRVDKNSIRAVLVSLEARTGRKVVYQDEEARKAGKG